MEVAQIVNIQVKLYCPECGKEVWDLQVGHKLAKCWNCMIAFLPEPEDWRCEDEVQRLDPSQSR